MTVVSKSSNCRRLTEIAPQAATAPQMASPAPEARVVRKAGEGYDKPNAEQELPIDINYQKLSEWLVGAHLAEHLTPGLAVAARSSAAHAGSSAP